MIKKENYIQSVDNAYEYFLKQEHLNNELDVLLDTIDDYDSNSTVEYYSINDKDFETYRLKRKITRGIESETSNKTVTDVFNEVIQQEYSK